MNIEGNFSFGIDNPSFNPLIRHLTSNELYNLYIIEGLTVREIYTLCGYKTPAVIQRQLRKYHISRGREWSINSRNRLSKNWVTEGRLSGFKKQSETKKFLHVMTGPNNTNWKGGLSFEPYSEEFNEELKEQIRVRDNYTCQLCGTAQEELDRKLNVHHINYNKKNSQPSNLISLCPKCNGIVNYDRESWIIFFRMVIV